MSKRKSGLLDDAEGFARHLLKRAKINTVLAGTSAPLDGEGIEGTRPSGYDSSAPTLDEQIDVLNAVTKFVAVKYKVAPEDGTDDFFSTARRNIASGDAAATPGGAASKRGARRAKAAPADRSSEPFPAANGALHGDQRTAAELFDAAVAPATTGADSDEP